MPGDRAPAAARVLRIPPPTSTREPAVKHQRSLLRTALYLAVLLLPGCVVFTCRVP